MLHIGVITPPLHPLMDLSIFLHLSLLIPNSSPMGDEIRHLGLLAHLIDFLPHVLGAGLQCSFTVK